MHCSRIGSFRDMSCYVRQLFQRKSPEHLHCLTGTAWQTPTHMSQQWMSVLCQYCSFDSFCSKLLATENA